MKNQEHESRKSGHERELEVHKYKELQINLLEIVDQVLQDPEILAEAEAFHKKATSIPPEKLLRPFDI